MALSITATGNRILAADGSKYNYLFPAPVKEDPIIHPDASVEHTVKEMVNLVKKYSHQTAKLADLLKGRSIAESTRNIWEFIYSNIQYKEDKTGVEQLRTPARTWADRIKGVDCDCMSIFASSLLTNMGIDHQFRITKYGKPDYQHVYVVVPGSGLNGKYFVIDGVLDKYDYELEYTAKKDFSAMNGITLQVLNGPEIINKEDRLKEFLISQRHAIIAAPEKISTVIHYTNALQLLDFVIDNWPEAQDRASAIIEAYEKEKQFHPRSKLFATIVKWYDGKAKCADIEKAAWIKVENGLGMEPKNVWAEYGLFAPRQAFLLLLRLNLFHYADKMAPAYFGGLNDQVAAQNQFTPDLRAKYAAAFGMTAAQQKANRDKVQLILNKWHDKLGGDWSGLKNATMAGAHKMLQRVSNLPGYTFWKKWDDWGGKPEANTSPTGIGAIEIESGNESNLQGELGGDPMTLGATLTAAAAIIAALAPLIGPLIKPGNADPTVSDAGDPLMNPALLAELQAQAAKDGYTESGSTWKTVGIVTGVAAVLGGIAYLIMSKNNKKNGSK